jgi:ribose transport system substrate-binding protein
LLAAATTTAIVGAASAQDAKVITDKLPAELKAQYEGAPQNMTPSAWTDFKVPAGEMVSFGILPG